MPEEKEGPDLWIIRKSSDTDYAWSDTRGWVNDTEFDLYDEDGRLFRPLPPGGVWDKFI